MYVGRFLIVAPGGGAYRVSSRSFPNREMVVREGGRTLTVVPTDDAPQTDNPYVSYNCLRRVGTPTGRAVAFGNGSHVDPIAEKVARGYPARDAVVESLLALDYEKDEYDTPRIAATIAGDGPAVVGIVRRDALLVRAVDEPTLVATYEKDAPEPVAFEVADAESAARAAFDLEFEHAVCAVGVSDTGDGFETAVVDDVRPQ